jgi:TRAP-type C4-dicarboxylate transport system permease small subunit
MQQAVSKITRVSTTCLQWLLIAAVTLLVFDVVWGVLTRYVGGEQASWTEELARFLLIWVSLLGGAAAFEQKSHLGVDYFVTKFDDSIRGNLKAFSYAIVLFFAISIFVVGGSRVVYNALVLDQTTPALGWKMGHVYLAIPISGVFMTLFTIANLLELRSGQGNDESKEPS